MQKPPRGAHLRPPRRPGGYDKLYTPNNLGRQLKSALAPFRNSPARLLPSLLLQPRIRFQPSIGEPASRSERPVCLSRVWRPPPGPGFREPNPPEEAVSACGFNPMTRASPGDATGQGAALAFSLASVPAGLGGRPGTLPLASRKRNRRGRGSACACARTKTASDSLAPSPPGLADGQGFRTGPEPGLQGKEAALTSRTETPAPTFTPASPAASSPTSNRASARGSSRGTPNTPPDASPGRCAHNGQPYNGINVLMLWASAMAQGFAAPDLDDLPAGAGTRRAMSRKGETGSLVVYADRITRTETDEQTARRSSATSPS